MRGLGLGLLGSVALASCGGGDGGGTTGGTGAATTTASVGDDWARDACKTFPVAAAAKASGIPVTKAETKHQNEANGTTLSTCSYQTADEQQHFTIMLRMNTDGSQTMRNHIAELSDADGMMGPAEPVTVAKGEARFQPKLQQIVYFPDDARVVNVVGPGVNPLGKSDPDAVLKERSLRIAVAAAG